MIVTKPLKTAIADLSRYFLLQFGRGCSRPKRIIKTNIMQ